MVRTIASAILALLLIFGISAAETKFVEKTFQTFDKSLTELYKKAEDVKEWLKTVNKEDNKMDFGYVLKETGELIGSGGIYFHEDEGNRWGIGYNLAYDAWGKGYATEAISKIIEYARSRFDIKEIYGTFAVENNGSRRVMEKLGMTFFEDCEYSKFDGSRTYKAKTYRKEF